MEKLCPKVQETQRNFFGGQQLESQNNCTYFCFWKSERFEHELHSTVGPFTIR